MGMALEAVKTIIQTAITSLSVKPSHQGVSKKKPSNLST